jgi:hypothetical protein
MTNALIPSVALNSTVSDNLGNNNGGIEWYDSTNAYYYEAFLLSNPTPGVPVSISLASNNFDTWLGVYDLDTNKYVAFDDNGGGGTNSALSFTPTYGDSYAIVISSSDFSHNATGNYKLSVAG